LSSQIAAEKRMYLPLAAVVTVLVVLSWRGLKSLGERRGRVFAVLVTMSALLLGARTWMRNRTYGSELQVYEANARDAPNNPRALANLGMALARAERPREGLAQLDRALESAPNVACFHDQRAYVCLRLGWWQEAERGWRRAIALQPNYALSHLNLSQLVLNRGDIKEAWDLADRAVKLAPLSASAWFMCGNVATAQGNWAEAERAYSRTIELDPAHGEACCSRGNARRMMGRLDPALADMDRGAALLAAGLEAAEHKQEPRRKLVLALMNRGLVKQAQKRFEAAAEDFTSAWNLEPKFLDALKERALCWEAREEWREAEKDYALFLASAPGHGEARLRRAHCLYRLGEYEAAWAEVRRLREQGMLAPEEFLEALRRASGRRE
jgi:tetratricopeptide (TPR) repeat protein